MKKNKVKQIIKEEVQKVLTEQQQEYKAFFDKMKQRSLKRKEMLKKLK